MKRNKLKSLVKSERKAAENNIKLSLISELTGLAGKLGQNSKKLTKEIEKGSKSLAKKLAKTLKINQSGIKNVPVSSKTGGISEKAKSVVRKQKMSSPKVSNSETSTPSLNKNTSSKPAIVKSQVPKISAIRKRIRKTSEEEIKS